MVGIGQSMEFNEPHGVNGRNGLKMQVSMLQYYLSPLNQEPILMLKKLLITSNHWKVLDILFIIYFYFRIPLWLPQFRFWMGRHLRWKLPTYT
jgi:hypothetical protein